MLLPVHDPLSACLFLLTRLLGTPVRRNGRSLSHFDQFQLTHHSTATQAHDEARRSEKLENPENPNSKLNTHRIKDKSKINFTILICSLIITRSSLRQDGRRSAMFQGFWSQVWSFIYIVPCGIRIFDIKGRSKNMNSINLPRRPMLFLDQGRKFFRKN